MSEIAAPALTPAAVPRWPAITLSRVRSIGYALLGLQLIGFMTWSAILYNHFSLSYDYSAYHQGWYLIAHGDLNPYSSAVGARFWQVHGELIYWPIALLYWIWPHDLMLQWVVDLGLVAGEVAALSWICEIAGKLRAGRHAAWFAAVGAALLIADPWAWQTVSFDAHTEPMALVFVVLLSRNLANSRRRAWAWGLPLLLCGDVVVTYLIGIGLGTVLTNRRARVQGMVVVSVGALAFAAIVIFHANVASGNGLRAYAYLTGAPVGAAVSMSGLVKGVLTHPLIALRVLASRTPNMWANLAAPGILGIFYIPIIPILAIVFLANNLWPQPVFSAPLFQSVPIYILVPFGTIAVLIWVYQRHRITALVLSYLVLAQALIWAAVWMPWIPGEWLRVPTSTAATLAATHATIPPDDEVIASQGVIGRFSDRAVNYPLTGSNTLPVHGETWFVIAPFAGIETASTANEMAFIAELAGPLRATLVTHANGIWVFRWRPPAGITSVTIPGELSPLQAWTSAGPAGRSVLTGPVSYWYATATGTRGYVTDLLAWQVPTGRYLAKVQLATSGPVNVEVWDDTGKVLLARQTVPDSEGPVNVSLPVDARTAYQLRPFPGWGPFHADLTPPPPGERLEVRVWSPGDTRVHVYSAELTPAPGD